MPAPPGLAMIRSPVVVLVLTLPPFSCITLLVTEVLTTSTLVINTLPTTTKLPPTYRFPPMPTPPGTTNAPVVVLVEGVVFVMFKLPICIGPLSKLITFELP